MARSATTSSGLGRTGAGGGAGASSSNRLTSANPHISKEAKLRIASMRKNWKRRESRASIALTAGTAAQWRARAAGWVTASVAPPYLLLLCWPSPALTHATARAATVDCRINPLMPPVTRASEQAAASHDPAQTHRTPPPAAPLPLVRCCCCALMWLHPVLTPPLLCGQLLRFTKAAGAALTRKNHPPSQPRTRDQLHSRHCSALVLFQAG